MDGMDEDRVFYARMFYFTATYSYINRLDRVLSRCMLKIVLVPFLGTRLMHSAQCN